MAGERTGEEAALDERGVRWTPQPGPQTDFVTAPVFEVVYGGARGGGKTDGVLGDWLRHSSLYGAKARGLMVRRKRTQLIDTIRRAKELFIPLRAQWKEQDKIFTMPNGASLRMAYLESDANAEEYQGHSYTRLYVEELTNFPDSGPVNKLKATLRSAEGVPVGMRATCNPGGPGHQWVKNRYIDPAPVGYEVIADDDGLERVFIPAKVQDNPALTQADPLYVTRLKQSGSEELVRAWLDGDWDVVLGAFFDCWRSEDHVIRPVTLPAHWTRFCAMDWGSARPFSVGWYAVATEAFEHPDGYVIPQNALIRYREWYGMVEGKPNTGLKMTAEAVAAGIRERETPDEEIAYRVADPSMFARDGGPSLTERMLKWCTFRRADNRRVPQRGALGGWDQVRARLLGEGGKPMLYVFNTGVHLIRTLPALQHDENRPEDVDTESEDHAPDELRYACMSRPYTQPEPTKEEEITRLPTFMEAVELNKKARPESSDWV